MAHDRVVAGLRCLEVLDELSAYIDEEVTPQQIEAHLAGCDWCARFGGDVAGTVAEIRRTLAPADRTPEDVVRRLDAALEALEPQTSFTKDG